MIPNGLTSAVIHRARLGLLSPWHVHARSGQAPDFYENTLGFKPVRCDIIKMKEGGRIRHILFDTGGQQRYVFM